MITSKINQLKKWIKESKKDLNEVGTVNRREYHAKLIGIALGYMDMLEDEKEFLDKYDLDEMSERCNCLNCAILKERIKEISSAIEDLKEILK